MSNGVISLDDLASSSNDSGSTASETNDDSGSVDDRFERLEELCEEIGADFENAKQRAVDDDGIDLDDMLTFAENIAESDDLKEVMESYRRWNDQKRFVQNYLYNDDAHEYSAWLNQFWGDSDDPEPDTYNYATQQSRDRDDNPGGLYVYKALFPEPATEVWPDEAVLLVEKPGDDSHIYVTKSWALEYQDFTIEINGEEVPRPPSDGEINHGALQDDGDDGGTGAPFNPSNFTNDEIRDKLGTSPEEDFTEEGLEALLAAENEGKGRKGATKAIKGSLNQLRSAKEQEQQTLDDASDSDDGESAAAMAGEIFAKHDLTIDDPDHIKGMLQGGMTKDEIIKQFGK